MRTNPLLMVLAGVVASVLVGHAQTVTKAATQTATATITAIDSATRSLTLRSEKGEQNVEDKKNIENVVVGDRIDVTYSQAVVVNAEPTK
jgi:ABC-type enterochelin transport system substrate-binding protein